jgi:CRP-like cAMP-binding protein
LARESRTVRIMLALEPKERERLLAATSPVSLDAKQILLSGGDRIDTVYFPDNAVVSLLTTMDDGTTVEVANIGNEGIVGVSVFLGVDTLGARECYQVEVPGQARAMDVATFIKAAGREPLRSLVEHYIQAQFTQVAQRMACVALHSIPERCSRWLLLTHDRVGDREFPLTQEFLAQMLGVRRASVTAAAGALQDAGLIRYSRGRVTVLDREGLEKAACECYGIIRGELERLLHLPRAPVGP